MSQHLVLYFSCLLSWSDSFQSHLWSVIIISVVPVTTTIDIVNYVSYHCHKGMKVQTFIVVGTYESEVVPSV